MWRNCDVHNSFNSNFTSRVAKFGFSLISNLHAVFFWLRPNSFMTKTPLGTSPNHELGILFTLPSRTSPWCVSMTSIISLSDNNCDVAWAQGPTLAILPLPQKKEKRLIVIFALATNYLAPKVALGYRWEAWLLF